MNRNPADLKLVEALRRLMAGGGEAGFGHLRGSDDDDEVIALLCSAGFLEPIIGPHPDMDHYGLTMLGRSALQSG